MAVVGFRMCNIANCRNFCGGYAIRCVEHENLRIMTDVAEMEMGLSIRSPTYRQQLSEYIDFVTMRHNDITMTATNVETHSEPEHHQ